jgi:hypothetical protein
MITSCTFIPSRRVFDLLCMLWVRYGTLGETREALIELRSELGPVEFARFEKDLVRWMERKSARTAIHKIIRAAILRGEEQAATAAIALSQHEQGKKQTRTIYEPA